MVGHAPKVSQTSFPFSKKMFEHDVEYPSNVQMSFQTKTSFELALSVPCRHCFHFSLRAAAAPIDNYALLTPVRFPNPLTPGNQIHVSWGTRLLTPRLPPPTGSPPTPSPCVRSISLCCPQMSRLSFDLIASTQSVCTLFC